MSHKRLFPPRPNWVRVGRESLNLETRQTAIHLQKHAGGLHKQFEEPNCVRLPLLFSPLIAKIRLCKETRKSRLKNDPALGRDSFS